MFINETKSTGPAGEKGALAEREKKTTANDKHCTNRAHEKQKRFGQSWTRRD